MEALNSTAQGTRRALAEMKLRQAIVTILKAIGEDPDRDGLKETPDRIMRMFGEIFRGYDPAQKPKITTFPNEHKLSELIFDSGEYYSMCEHHILPFFGKYYFAYIPSQDGHILGISKVARVVGYCAARLQLQEHLASQIIKMLSEALEDNCLGMAIVMRGQHLCKTMRGIKNKGQMSVVHVTGVFKDPGVRQQFFDLIKQEDG